MAVAQGVHGLLGRFSYWIRLVSSHQSVCDGGLILWQLCTSHTCLRSSRLLSKSVTSRRARWRRLSKGTTYVCCSPTHHRQRRTGRLSAATTLTSRLNMDTTLMRHPLLRTGVPQEDPAMVTVRPSTAHRQIHTTDRTLSFAMRSYWRRTTG